MKPTLLVLAAGMGSRYGGLKQIDPVGDNGETIIDFSIFDAIKTGFNRVVFVIRRDIEKDFREIIGRKYENRVDVDYVFQQLEDIPAGFKVPEERKKPWGTGHAILCAKKAIKEPFAVINGDDFYGRDSFNVLSDFLNKVDAASNEYSIVAFILKNTLSEFGSVSRGVCSSVNDNSTVNKVSYLEKIVEYTKIEKSGKRIYNTESDNTVTEFSGNECVSMNMFGFTPGIFQYLETEFNEFLKKNADNPRSELYIPAVVSTLIYNNLAKVRLLQTDSSWLGITYQEDKENVKNSIRKLISEKIYPDKLW